MTTLQTIASLLLEQDDIGILTHKNPDGDTIGSGFGLMYGLQQLGKRAKVVCADPFPTLFQGFTCIGEDFTPKFWVSVDVADPSLLGQHENLAKDITICIDHHRINRMECPYSYVDAAASSTCEVVYELLCQMGVTLDAKIAEALYTGICTDTGCFQYSNTSAKTHRITADLMDTGMCAEPINRANFGTKTRGRLAIEQQVIAGIEYACDNRVAMAVISQEMVQNAGVSGEEIAGVAAIVRQIEGVEAGILLKETTDGMHKVSLRTSEVVDASVVCALFGGGGHARASGCLLGCDLTAVKAQLVQAIAPYFA